MWHSQLRLFLNACVYEVIFIVENTFTFRLSLDLFLGLYYISGMKDSGILNFVTVDLGIADFFVL